MTIPHDVLEWFASVKDAKTEKEIWYDWMDYSGYDDRPDSLLEIEMAKDISEFIDRVVISDFNEPLEIWKNTAQQDAAANP